MKNIGDRVMMVDVERVRRKERPTLRWMDNINVDWRNTVGRVDAKKVKVCFLYSALSSPSDRSKQSALQSATGRLVHSDTN